MTRRTLQECFDLLVKGAGKDFNREDLSDIFERLKDAANKAQDEGSVIFEALKTQGKESYNDAAFLEDAKEFMFWRKMQVKNTALTMVDRFKGRKNGVFRALKSYIDGSQFLATGSRDSFDLNIQVLKSRYMDDLKMRLDKDDLLPAFNSKDHEIEIARAIATGSSTDPMAQKIGREILKSFDLISNDYKRMGAFVEDLPTRITRNYHNPSLLMKSASDIITRQSDRIKLTPKQYKEKAFNRWKDFTLPLLDKKRTFGRYSEDTNKQIEILRGMYRTLTNNGDYLKAPETIPVRLKNRRRLHWKDPESNIVYNREYGTGTLHSAIFAELEKSATQVASLKFFGDSRSNFLKSVLDTVKKELPEDFDRFSQRQLRSLTNLMDTAAGALNDPSSKIATIGGNIRAAQNISKLGGVTLRSLPDLSVAALEMKSIYGSYFKAAYNSLLSVGRGLSKMQRKEFGELLRSQVYNDLGNNTRWFNAEGMPAGAMAKLQRLFFKVNALSYWDRGIKSDVKVVHARHLGMNAKNSFKDMVSRDKKFGEENVRKLEAYNISGDDWDLIRQYPTRLSDRSYYILPESADMIPDSKIASVLAKEGAKKINKTRINEKREQLRDRLEAYFTDRADFAVLRPGAQDRNTWWQGSRSGTAVGQVLRNVAQFKAYGTTYVTKPLGRLIYGKGADSFWEAMFKGKADYAGMAQLLTYSALLGYIGLSARQMAGGATPPDPTSKDTIIKSLEFGGFFAIYGDLVLSNDTSFGRSSLENVAGPGLNELSSIFDLATDPIHGNYSTDKVWRLIRPNVPFQNLFYTKYLTDRFLINRMQESLTPGYMSRRERNLRKRGQEFFLPQR